MSGRIYEKPHLDHLIVPRIAAVGKPTRARTTHMTKLNCHGRTAAQVEPREFAMSHRASVFQIAADAHFA